MTIVRRMLLCRLPLLSLSLALVPSVLAAPRQGAVSSHGVAVGDAAPDFTLPDAFTGKPRDLSKIIGLHRPDKKVASRSVALFFFCGCPACRALGTEWARYQQAGLVPLDTATVIVYSTSDRVEARQRAASCGLDPKRTAVLCDTDALNVTEALYQAEPCPRIVIINRTGMITYSNTLADEKPQEAPATRLAARALAALGPASNARIVAKP